MGIKVFKNKPVKNTNRKLGVFILTGSVFITSILGLSFWTKASNQTIDIVVAKKSVERVPGKTLVNQESVEKGSVTKKNFENSMVKWEDLEKYKDKYYTDIPLRGGSPVYTDILSKERISPGEWLKEIGEGERVVTIPYNYLSAGGKLLLPGDRIDYLVTSEDPFTGGVKSTLLLPGVVVKDMLNNTGESIYAKYREIALHDEATKEKLQKSDEFRKFITPVSLMVSTTPTIVKDYAEFNFEGKFRPTIALLQRNVDNSDQQVIYSTIKQFLDNEDNKDK